MMKILFLFVAVLLLQSCGSNRLQGGEAEAFSAPVDSLTIVDEVKPAPAKRAVKSPDNDMWTESAVEAQIRACFDEVNKMAAADGIDVAQLDAMYCSKDFLELKSLLEKKVQKGEVTFDGDEGYHWTAGIATPLTVDSVKPELLKREQAQAEVWLKDQRDSTAYMELSLYLEDGAWKIHNWVDTDVYPFGALFNWMQSVYDGDTDDEETEANEQEEQKPVDE